MRECLKVEVGSAPPTYRQTRWFYVCLATDLFLFSMHLIPFFALSYFHSMLAYFPHCFALLPCAYICQGRVAHCIDRSFSLIALLSLFDWFTLSPPFFCLF
ncbi:unnamed protein product, partial [Phaeothamnion confervicola]